MKKVKFLLIVLLMSSAFETAFSQDAKHYFDLGFKESDAGNYTKAIEYYTISINIYSNLATPYYNRGIAYYFLDKYDEAISDYTMAITINPNFTKAYYNRGLAYYCLHKYDDAEDYIELGSKEFDEGNYNKAIEYYTIAINLDPNYASAYKYRGNAYDKLQKYDEAFSDFTKAISIDSNDADVYYECLTGSYKIGKEIWVIEKEGSKLIIKNEESVNGWILTKPYDIDGKIGFDAINSGGIIEFWLIFDDETYQTGIMERKYGQKDLEIKKLE